jgi:hypothetical protein
VFGVVEVLGSVFVLRGVAAADVAAGKARSKMDPGVAELDALVADIGFGRLILAVLKMLAKGHGGRVSWKLLLRLGTSISDDAGEVDARFAVGVVWRADAPIMKRCQ